MGKLGEAPVGEAARSPFGRRRRRGADVRDAVRGSGAARRWAAAPESPSAPAILRREAVYRRGLVLADLVAAGCALCMGLIVLGDDRLSPAALAAAPFVVLVSKTLGLYDRDEHLLKKSTLDELPALFQVATLYALVLWLIESVIVEGYLSKEQVVGLWGLLFLAMAVGRAVARRLARLATPPERCLVIGSHEATSWIRVKVEGNPGIKATVLGRLAFETAPELDDEDAELLGHLDDVAQVVTARNVDRVVIAPEGSDQEAALEAVRMVKALGVRVSVLPRLFEVMGSSVEFDDLDGTTLLGLRRYGLPRSSQRLKRATDVLGGAVGMILTAPLLLLAAAAVKLSSPGPVIFRQRRIGRDGRDFSMLKFRTMFEGADEQKPALHVLNEADGLFKIAEDPRITPVGRFLRRSSLDELPQLLNVLRGEMSLVGPRPLVPEDDSRVEGWERRRLHLYPGMTGVWQVFGSARIPLAEMVKIDYLYAANWSLWLDCKILLQTIPHVLFRRGL
jgi:exopolysaccharide biosynthesis polyprenyl glycosylphosphotransferase